MKKKYKAAIVGCGRIASLFAADKKRKAISTHAQAYLAHPRAQLVAACDLDQQRLSEFGKKWGVKKLYTHFDQMMREVRPELVSICTWNSTHEALLQKALSGGVKGVICEKPIADHLAAADRMIDLCRRKGVPLLVNYSRRYNRLHRHIADAIRRGELGEIQTVSCYYTAGVMNTGTHLFDLLRFLFGDVKWVWTNPDKVLQADDPTLDMVLFFKKGFACNISALNVKNYMQFEIDIYGTKGRLRIEDSGMKMQFWKIVPHKTYSGYRTLVPHKILNTDFSRNLYTLVDNLIAAVERKSEPFCSGSDGARSLEIGCAAHVSLKNGQLVALPLKNKTLRFFSR